MSKVASVLLILIAILLTFGACRPKGEGELTPGAGEVNTEPEPKLPSKVLVERKVDVKDLLEENSFVAKGKVVSINRRYFTCDEKGISHYTGKAAENCYVTEYRFDLEREYVEDEQGSTVYVKVRAGAGQTKEEFFASGGGTAEKGKHLDIGETYILFLYQTSASRAGLFGDDGGYELAADFIKTEEGFTATLPGSGTLRFTEQELIQMAGGAAE